jgi:hypothetical protein
MTEDLNHRVSLIIPESLWIRIREAGKKELRSTTKIIQIAIERFLEKEEK